MKTNKTKKFFIFICILLASVFSILGTIVLIQESEHVALTYEERLLDNANLISRDQTVVNGVISDEINLQNHVNTQYIDVLTSIDQVVIVDDNWVVLTHYNESLIGTTYDEGFELDAFSGATYIITESDFDNDTRRAFAPIYSEGQIEGIVSVGLSIDVIHDAQQSRIANIVMMFSSAMFVSLICVYVIYSQFKADLLGFTSSEICMLYAENKSIIDQLDEAVISVDKDFKILTINNSFRVMFGFTDSSIGKNANELFPDIRFDLIIENDEHIMSKYQKIENRKVLMNAFPLYQDDKIIGASAVFRSYLEVDTLLDQIKGYQEVSEALRSQKHEFQNKLHVVLGLIKIGDYLKAENYIMQNVYTTNLASDYYSSRIKDDRILALFVGKEIQCKEHNCSLLLTSDSYLSKTHYPINSDDIVLILGNLIDNSIDAYENKDIDDKRIVVDIFEDESLLKINVVDEAGGIKAEIIDHMFERGISSKVGDSRGTGLSLVSEIVSVYNGEKNVFSSLEETKIEIILGKVTL